MVFSSEEHRKISDEVKAALLSFGVEPYAEIRMGEFPPMDPTVERKEGIYFCWNGRRFSPGQYEKVKLIVEKGMISGLTGLGFAPNGSEHSQIKNSTKIRFFVNVQALFIHIYWKSERV